MSIAINIDFAITIDLSTCYMATGITAPEEVQHEILHLEDIDKEILNSYGLSGGKKMKQHKLKAFASAGKKSEKVKLLLKIFLKKYSV